MSNEAVSAALRGTINPLVLEMARQAKSLRTVTFSAARRRFERKRGASICKLSRGSMLSMNGAEYAICENNFFTDWGGIDAVNDWCRDAGVLAHDESVVEA
ncbi:hypothetical protein [Bradyrhizobium sp. 33ap4]|uniref:hypothetical protein n=1 Tax=Bradyrhizobium sp. 33ap4 TaxID=3061630 RepID=UPI00292F2821|nr:hypothetical protein [Bradyrhizobium sp. 33ap4]